MKYTLKLTTIEDKNSNFKCGHIELIDNDTQTVISSNVANKESAYDSIRDMLWNLVMDNKKLDDILKLLDVKLEGK